MADRTTTHCFKQLHVDVARNATDDFNPFHDPHRWHQIRDNPFGGPIVLGFQLAALADSLVQVKRETEPDDLGAKPRYSSYEFRFAGALRPNESFTTQVRRTVRAQGEERAAVHRMIFRKQTGEPILLGSRSDSLRPAGSSSWRNCQYEPIGETGRNCSGANPPPRLHVIPGSGHFV